MSSRGPSKLRYAVVVATACAAGTACASDGALDPTFGMGGIVRTGRSGTILNAVAVRPDGRIVACGTWQAESTGSKIAVVQHLADGTPDREFGADGERVIIATPEPALCTGIALQADGRVLVSGRSIESIPPPGWNAVRIVARLTPSGALDPSFAGGTGIHVSHSGYANALTLQRDGKILVAGYGPVSSASLASDFQVMRLLPDGSIDTTFGDAGVAMPGFASGIWSNMATALAIDAEGRAVVAGSAAAQGSDGYRLAAVRFQTDGRVDTSFGTGGEALGPFGVKATGIAIQRDGALVLSGIPGGFYPQSMAMRLLDNGSIDAGFGDDGIVVVRWSDGTRDWATLGSAIAIQSDDRIVVAGATYLLKTFGLLGRLDGSGRPDPTFGVGGVEALDADHTAYPSSSFTAVTLAGGRIVAVGGVTDASGNYAGAIARFDIDLIFANGF